MVSYLDSYNNLQALQAFSHFAQKQGKPLVVSWSINDHEGLHDGTSTMALFVGEGTYLDPANKQQPYVIAQLCIEM